jgi:hypothetical protein
MPLRITVDIFSGRPNPVIELDGKAATQALARLRPARPMPKNAEPPPVERRLGYRGLIVEQVGGRPKGGLPQTFRVSDGLLFGKNLFHRAEDEQFEDSVIHADGLVGGLNLGAPVLKALASDQLAFREWLTQKWDKPIRRPPTRPCPLAPRRETFWWEDGGTRQLGNNCYNYATNYRTDTFAQPGRAADSMYASLTVAAVRKAAEADALASLPTADNKCPDEGHLVALVVAPGVDYHWLRKGRDGLWSFKPGRNQVTELDNNSDVVADPRKANLGIYTEFGGFMLVMHGRVMIR